MRITEKDIGRVGVTRVGNKVPMTDFRNDGGTYPAKFADKEWRTVDGLLLWEEEDEQDIIAWADEQPVGNTDKLAELEARVAALEAKAATVVETPAAEPATPKPEKLWDEFGPTEGFPIDWEELCQDAGIYSGDLNYRKTQALADREAKRRFISNLIAACADKANRDWEPNLLVVDKCFSVALMPEKFVVRDAREYLVIAGASYFKKEADAQRVADKLNELVEKGVL